jgi:protease I
MTVMGPTLQDQRVAILATDGVEQVELTASLEALKQAGAEVHLVSPKPDRIQAVNGLDKGHTFQVDRALQAVRASEYDALVLPGGVASPDALRTDVTAVQFVREFFAQGKPVGAICHGPWMLVEADVVRHRTVTSWPSLRTDICNAGGCWVDEAVHCDQRLVTSRKLEDLPDFCSSLIQVIATTGALRREAAGESDTADSQSTGQDVAVDLSSEDSFPASDSPSSLKVT